jgi:hypothetical protein
VKIVPSTRQPVLIPLEVLTGEVCPLYSPTDPRLRRFFAHPNPRGTLQRALEDLEPGRAVTLTAGARLPLREVLAWVMQAARKAGRTELVLPVETGLSGKSLARAGLDRLVLLTTGKTAPPAEFPVSAGLATLILVWLDTPGETLLAEWLRLAARAPELVVQVEPGPGADLPSVARQLSAWYEQEAASDNVVVQGLPPCLLTGRLRGDFLQNRLLRRDLVHYFEASPPPWVHPLPADRGRLRQVEACAGCLRQTACPGVSPEDEDVAAATQPLTLEALPRAVPVLPRTVPMLPKEHLSAGVREIFSCAAPWAVHFTVSPDRLALERGLKGAFRWVVPAAEVEVLRRLAAGAGWAMLVLETPVRESGLDSRLTPDVASGEQAVSRVVYVGTDKGRLRRLRAVDAELLHGRVGGNGQAVLNTEMGALLDYPPCCVKAFSSGQEDSAATLARIVGRSERLDYRLNHLSPTLFSYLPWYPCRFDCPASLEYAGALEEAVREKSPAQAALIARLLGAPRLYWSKRRQLLLDSQAAPGAPRVFLPWNGDFLAEALAEELAFARDLPPTVWTATAFLAGEPPAMWTTSGLEDLPPSLGPAVFLSWTG